METDIKIKISSSSKYKSVRAKLHSNYISWSDLPEFIPNISDDCYFPIVSNPLISFNTTDERKLTISISQCKRQITIKFNTNEIRTIWLRQILLRCQLMENPYLNQVGYSNIWTQILENKNNSRCNAAFRTLMWASPWQNSSSLEPILTRIACWLNRFEIYYGDGNIFSNCVAQILFQAFENPMLRVFLFLVEPSENYLSISSRTIDDLLNYLIMQITSDEKWLKEKDSLLKFVDHPGCVVMNDQEYRWHVQYDNNKSSLFHSPLNISYSFFDSILHCPSSLPYYLMMKWFKGREHEAVAVNRLLESLGKLPLSYFDLRFSLHGSNLATQVQDECHYHIARDYCLFFVHFDRLNLNSYCCQHEQQRRLLFELWNSRSQTQYFADCWGQKHRISNVFWCFSKDLTVKTPNLMIDRMLMVSFQWLTRIMGKQNIHFKALRNLFFLSLSNPMIRVLMCSCLPSCNVDSSNQQQVNAWDEIMNQLKLFDSNEVVQCFAKLVEYPIETVEDLSSVDLEIAWSRNISSRLSIDLLDIHSFLNGKPSLLWLYFLQKIDRFNVRSAMKSATPSVCGSVEQLAQELMNQFPLIPAEFFSSCFPSSFYLDCQENHSFISVVRRDSCDSIQELPHLLEIVRYCKVTSMMHLFQFPPLKNFSSLELFAKIWLASCHDSHLSVWKSLCDFPSLSFRDAHEIAEEHILKLQMENHKFNHEWKENENRMKMEWADLEAQKGNNNQLKSNLSVQEEELRYREMNLQVHLTQYDNERQSMKQEQDDLQEKQRLLEERERVVNDRDRMLEERERAVNHAFVEADSKLQSLTKMQEECRMKSLALEERARDLDASQRLINSQQEKLEKESARIEMDKEKLKSEEEKLQQSQILFTESSEIRKQELNAEESKLSSMEMDLVKKQQEMEERVSRFDQQQASLTLEFETREKHLCLRLQEAKDSEAEVAVKLRELNEWREQLENMSCMMMEDQSSQSQRFLEEKAIYLNDIDIKERHPSLRMQEAKDAEAEVAVKLVEVYEQREQLENMSCMMIEDQSSQSQRFLEEKAIQLNDIEIKGVLLVELVELTSMTFRELNEQREQLENISCMMMEDQSSRSQQFLEEKTTHLNDIDEIRSGVLVELVEFTLLTLRELNEQREQLENISCMMMEDQSSQSQRFLEEKATHLNDIIELNKHPELLENISDDAGSLSSPIEEIYLLFNSETHSVIDTISDFDDHSETQSHPDNNSIIDTISDFDDHSETQSEIQSEIQSHPDNNSIIDTISDFDDHSDSTSSIGSNSDSDDNFSTCFHSKAITQSSLPHGSHEDRELNRIDFHTLEENSLSQNSDYLNTLSSLENSMRDLLNIMRDFRIIDNSLQSNCNDECIDSHRLVDKITSVNSNLRGCVDVLKQIFNKYSCLLRQFEQLNMILADQKAWNSLCNEDLLLAISERSAAIEERQMDLEREYEELHEIEAELSTREAELVHSTQKFDQSYAVFLEHKKMQEQTISEEKEELEKRKRTLELKELHLEENLCTVDAKIAEYDALLKRMEEEEQKRCSIHDEKLAVLLECEIKNSEASQAIRRQEDMMKECLDQLYEGRSQMQEDRNELDRSRAALQQEKQSLEDRKMQMQEDRNELDRSTTALQQEKQSLEDRKKQVEEEWKKLKKMEEDLNQQQQLLANKIVDVEEKEQHYHTRINDINSDFILVQNLSEQLVAKEQDLQRKSDEVNKRDLDLQHKHRLIQDQENDLQQQKTEMTTNYDQKVQLLQCREATLTRQLERMSEMIIDANNVIDAARRREEIITLQLYDQNQVISRLENQMRMSEEDFDALSQRLTMPFINGDDDDDDYLMMMIDDD